MSYLTQFLSRSSVQRTQAPKKCIIFCVMLVYFVSFNYYLTFSINEDLIFIRGVTRLKRYEISRRGEKLSRREV